MSRAGHQSEPDLLSAVKKAASELSGSVAGSRVSHRSGGRSSYHSSGSGSGYSRSSRRSEKGFTLQQQQQAVQTAAMDRYITALQAEAQDAVKDAHGWTMKMQNDRDDETAEYMRKKEIAQRNSFLLKSQIEENKMRRAEDRREFIEAASTHSFPLFTETFISLEEYNQYLEDRKKNFHKELTAQLQCINTMKALEAKDNRDQALHNNKMNTFSMGKDRKAERDRLKNQGRDMVNSWDRDLRLHHIKKAILTGKDVVRQTLQPKDLPKQ